MSQVHGNNITNSSGLAKATTTSAPTHEHDELLRRYQTASSVIIPREVFEEIYFEPTARRKGTRLGTIFGNPTPMSVSHPVKAKHACSGKAKDRTSDGL